MEKKKFSRFINREPVIGFLVGGLSAHTFSLVYYMSIFVPFASLLFWVVFDEENLVEASKSFWFVISDVYQGILQFTGISALCGILSGVLIIIVRSWKISSPRKVLIISIAFWSPLVGIVATFVVPKLVYVADFWIFIGIPAIIFVISMGVTGNIVFKLSAKADHQIT